jgi:hypothetical protein
MLRFCPACRLARALALWQTLSVIAPAALLSLLLQLFGVGALLSGDTGAGSVIAILLVGAALTGIGVVAGTLRAIAEAARAATGSTSRPVRPGRSDVSTPAVQHRPDAPGRRLPRAPGAQIPAV